MNLQLSAPEVTAHAWKFAGLCFRIFALVLVAATCEGAILWLAGFRYVPPGQLHETNIGNVAVASDGSWAASCVGFRLTGLRGEIYYDVVLHDLRKASASRLNLRSLCPEVVAVSPETGELALGCSDGALYGCRVASAGGKMSESASVHSELISRLGNGPLSQLVFSPQGDYLAGADRTHVYLWHYPRGELLCRRAHGAAACPVMTFSRDGSSLLSHAGVNAVCLWETESGRCIQVLSLDAPIVNAALSPNRDRIAALVSDGTLRMVDLASGHEQWRRTWQRAEGQMLDFIKDGTEICIGGAGGRIRLHDVRQGEKRAPLDRNGIVLGYTIDAQGLLYSWSRGGDICVWSIDQRRAISNFSLLAWAQGKRQVQAEASDTRHRKYPST